MDTVDLVVRGVGGICAGELRFVGYPPMVFMDVVPVDGGGSLA